MPVRVSVSVSGVEEVLHEVAGLESRLADLTPALEIVADLLEAHVAQQFATEGRWAGTPWAPLADRTQRLRLAHAGSYRAGGLQLAAGPAGPILTWTGRLRLSFMRGSGEHVRTITADGLQWGSRVPYGGYHQSTLPRTRLPRRPMVAFRDAFQQREIAFQPLRLHLQGTPPGAIRAVLAARLGLGALGARLVV